MIGHKEEKHIRAVMRAIKARTAKATIIKVKHAKSYPRAEN
jgi:hypothetical protein